MGGIPFGVWLVLLGIVTLVIVSRRSGHRVRSRGKTTTQQKRGPDPWQSALYFAKTFAKKRNVWRIGAILLAWGMLLTAIYLVLGDFFPNWWGVAKGQAEGKYFWPIALSLAAVAIFYFTKSKKTASAVTTAASGSGRKSWMASLLESLFGLVVLVGMGAVLILGGWWVFAGLSSKMEGGCSGEATWLDGTKVPHCYAAVEGSKTYTVGPGQAVVVKAQVSLSDHAKHGVWEWIDGWFTRRGIITHTTPARVQKSVVVPCATEGCSVCVTVDVPNPLPRDWALLFLNKKGDIEREMLKPGDWYSASPGDGKVPHNVELVYYTTEFQGTAYFYGGPVEEAFTRFGSCHPQH